MLIEFCKFENFEFPKIVKIETFKIWNFHILKLSHSKLLNFEISRAVDFIENWMIFKIFETLKFKNFQGWNSENWTTYSWDFFSFEFSNVILLNLKLHYINFQTLEIAQFLGNGILQIFATAKIRTFK